MFTLSKPRYHQVRGLLVLLFLALMPLLAVQAQDTSTSEACTPSQPQGWVVYTVEAGDSLSDIAARTGSTTDDLQRANCLRDIRIIVVGQRLFVPRTPDPRPAPTDGIAERCRNAGLTIQQCRRIIGNDGNENNLAERCRNAGLTIQQCRRIIHGNELADFLERCLNAGYTETQCRRIYNALNDNNTGDLAERCRNAGLTTEECRRLWNANHDDNTGNLAERCRNAGLTPEECRRAYNASQDNGTGDLAERCRNAGLTPEECRRAYNASQDNNAGNDSARNAEDDSGRETPPAQNPTRGG